MRPGRRQGIYQEVFSRNIIPKQTICPDGHGPNNRVALDAPYLSQPQLRPFTARCHKPGLEGAFDHPGKCRLSRSERRESRQTQRGYASLLAQVADVENFQALDQGTLETF